MSANHHGRPKFQEQRLGLLCLLLSVNQVVILSMSLYTEGTSVSFMTSYICLHLPLSIIVVVDTNRWYHQTFIHAGDISITIGSEYVCV